MVTVSANQPATEDATGRCGPLPLWHRSPAASWTTFNRSSGRTLAPRTLPAGHPINPLVTGPIAGPRTKVSLGACGTPTISRYTTNAAPTTEVAMTNQ
jgi:hypothetical protein